MSRKRLGYKGKTTQKSKDFIAKEKKQEIQKKKQNLESQMGAIVGELGSLKGNLTKNCHFACYGDGTPPSENAPFDFPCDPSRHLQECF